VKGDHSLDQDGYLLDNIYVHTDKLSVLVPKIFEMSSPLQTEANGSQGRTLSQLVDALMFKLKVVMQGSEPAVNAEDLRSQCL